MQINFNPFRLLPYSFFFVSFFVFFFVSFFVAFGAAFFVVFFFVFLFLSPPIAIISMVYTNVNFYDYFTFGIL